MIKKIKSLKHNKSDSSTNDEFQNGDIVVMLNNNNNNNHNNNNNNNHNNTNTNNAKYWN